MKNNIQEKLIQTTCDLIKFETEPDNKAAKKEIIEFIKDKLKNKPVFFQEFESNKEPSILITFEKTNNPQVLLYSHLDVVPAPETEYNPQIKDGKIFGRGAGDMKSAAAVILELFLEFSEKEQKPSIGLMFTTDEEVGGFNGTKIMLEQGVNCEICIMPDSSKGTETLITNQKGIGMLKLWSYGVSAHGSRPHLGTNAIEKLVQHITKIRKLFPKKQTAKTKTTINTGTIKGGEQTNQIPEYAEATLDIRFQDPTDFYKKLNKIKKICDQNAEIELYGPAYQCDLKNQHVQNYIKTYKETTSQNIHFETESGGSDARFFSEKNIPVIVTGIRKANSHSIDEYCEIEDMELFYNILKNYINSYVDTIN